MCKHTKRKNVRHTYKQEKFWQAYKQGKCLVDIYINKK